MNNRGFFKVLGLTAAALLVAAFALQATAAEAETRTPGIQWVWSKTSADANKATAALASGHAIRGMRLARIAIGTAATASDRLIAIHNLCLAHLAQGDISGADRHCRAALLAYDNTHVILQRGALVTIVTEQSLHDDTLKLVTVIRTNVSEAYGSAAAHNFTSAVEAAAW